MDIYLKKILPTSTGTVIKDRPEEYSSLEEYPLARACGNNGEGEASAEDEARDAPSPPALHQSPVLGRKRGGCGQHLRVTCRAVMCAVRLHQLASLAVSDGYI